MRLPLSAAPVSLMPGNEDCNRRARSRVRVTAESVAAES